MQDSQSHRVIEKRRRDRMNSSLADLEGLVVNDCASLPGHSDDGLAKYASQGRIRKTEVIEMAIQRIRQLKSELSGLFRAADRWI